jgi:hypothetical protein
MDSGAQQDISAPDVKMDIGAPLDAPDTGAHASGAETTEDAGAGDKSTGTEKGKAPEVPEVRTDPAPASAEPAAPAALEQPAPKTPTTDKTVVPARTAVPAKSRALKIKQIIKTGTQSAATAPASARPAPPSSTMTLHFGKAAARPSFFDTAELEGRVSLLTKSDKSLGSLKENCMKWNDVDYMDTASSKKKKLAEALATGNPAAILAAKPIPIASELLSIQQRLHPLADATNVSILFTYPQSPKMSAVRDTDIRDFQILFCT